MLSGERTTSASRSCCCIRSRTRSNFSLSIGYGIAEPVPLSVLGAPFILPRFLFALDQIRERRMERRFHASQFGLARDRSAEVIHFSREMMTDIVQHGRWMVRLRTDFI